MHSIDKSIGTQPLSKTKITYLLLNVPAPGTGRHWVSDSTLHLVVPLNCLSKTKSIIIFPACKNWQYHILEKK